MLEMILDRHLVFILMGVFVGIGIVSKMVVSISLKKLTKAAGDMGKSNHSFMKLVRSKFEHACMVSDKVQNVEVFVEKYMHEHKIIGVRLHSWRRMERICAWMCALLGMIAAGMEYALYEMNDQVLKSAVLGFAVAIGLFLLRITTDEAYYLEMIRTYMIDYLENVCAHRYVKTKERMEQRGFETVEAGVAKTKETELYASKQEEEPEENARIVEMDTEQVRDQRISEKEREEILQKNIAAEIRKFEQPLNEEKKAESEKKSSVSKLARKKEQAAEKQQDPVSKEVLIREILEEFLA